MASSAAGIIRDFNSDREPERLAIKLAAMAGDPFPFLRGTCHLFYRRLAEKSLDPGGPPAWICGDLHLENFGTFLGDNGLTYFDLNDFDEAALAPVTWDIVRMATSVFIAAPGLKLSDSDAEILARDLVETWRLEMIAGKPRWIERKTATGIIGALMDSLKSRRPVKFLDKRTSVKKGVRRLDIANGKALALEISDRPLLAEFAAGLAANAIEQRYFRLIDAARRIAGTGSLGIARYVLLIEGAGSPDGNELLDLKAAKRSSIAAYSPCKQPDWKDDAERVVAVANRCQAVTPGLLSAVTFKGAPHVLRALQPTTDRLNLADAAAANRATFADAVHTMGKLAAWAALRATGRGGSATADDLIAFASNAAVTGTVLATARTMAAQTLADWKDYAAAFNAGAFGKTSKLSEESSEDAA